MSHFVPGSDSTSIPYFPMSWTFSYKDGDTDLTVCVSHEVCPRIVESFFHFLRGVGFSDAVVRDSLEELISEYFAE